MPIPDTVLPPEPKQEPGKKKELTVEEIQGFCNALLRKQLTCKTCCHNCLEKCQELQNWLDQGEN